MNHMTYEVARLITLPTLAVGSAVLVARYRGYGLVASVLLGWVILYGVYNAWPAPPGEWDEDREEMHVLAPSIMLIWCAPVWGVVELWRWFRRRKGARVQKN